MYFAASHSSYPSLHSIYTTGSPLAPESFDFIYRNIKQDVLLGSITGGTDIVSLFAGHNAALPVYRGEIQCRCLGMRIEAWTDDGKCDFGSARCGVGAQCLAHLLGKAVMDEPADLVCTSKLRSVQLVTIVGVGNHGRCNRTFPRYAGLFLER